MRKCTDWLLQLGEGSRTKPLDWSSDSDVSVSDFMGLIVTALRAINESLVEQMGHEILLWAVQYKVPSANL